MSLCVLIALLPHQTMSILTFSILLPFLEHRMDDGSQRMYYTGQGKGGTTAIGVAKLDMDANDWVRERATIVFAEA